MMLFLFYKNYVSFTNENYYSFTDYFQNELYYRENPIVYLDEDSVIRDVIDSSFKLIEGTTSDDIKVYLADVDYSTGSFGEKYLLEDDDINVTLSKNSLGQDVIDLKGYNFESNTVLDYNGTYDSGSKLIIEIPITFADKTECGNYINTNTDDTGIYCLNGSSEYRKVESFPKPTIDIPAKVSSFFNKNESMNIIGQNLYNVIICLCLNLLIEELLTTTEHVTYLGEQLV